MEPRTIIKRGGNRILFTLEWERYLLSCAGSSIFSIAIGHIELTAAMQHRRMIWMTIVKKTCLIHVSIYLKKSVAGVL